MKTSGSRNLLVAAFLLAVWAAPAEARFLQVDPVGYKDQNNLYAYVLDDPVNATDPTGLDTEVSLQYYILGHAPIQGDYGHQFVMMRDTDTGQIVISRGGPSSPYNGGSAAIISRSPVAAPNGQGPIRLVTQMRPAETSVDADHGRPLGAPVPGSQVTISGPVGDAQATLGSFNRSVDSANIPYRPLSTNSNAYAGTAYSVLTGRPAPATGVLPGSTVDLRPAINPPPPPKYDTCVSHPGAC